MKNLLLLSLIAAVSMTALSNTEPTTAWANLLIGKPGQDQATSIVTDGNNQVYWMLTDGSTTDDRNVTYAGEDLYSGSLYDGTSSNKNLTLLKTDANGIKQWCVYSSWGDFAPNEGGLAIKSNGDVVFSGTVRHTDGYLDHPITIVDAKGNSTTIEWTVERRWQRLVIGCVSSEGELLWVRTYDVDHSPVPAATGNYADHTADAISTTGIAVDDNDNIYVCGNYRTAFTLFKSDGTDVVLQPKNVAGWSGDPQSVVGSLFLVKLDGNGYYLNHLAEEGDDITASYLQKLEWKNGNLYAYGYLKGKENKSVKISGYTFTPTDFVCPLAGCFNSNLEASWIKCFPGDAVAGKNAIQNVGITIDGEALWLAGQYNGKISDSSDKTKFVASTQGNMREGFIIKLDCSDGGWLASANSKTDFTQNYLTGYFKVIIPESDSNYIYTFGYAMNASVGVFLRCYDRKTLTGYPDKSWNIVTKGGVPTCQDIAYEPSIGAAYVAARGNQAFQPIGGTITENPGGYTNLLARFNLIEDSKTVVEDIISRERKFSVSMAKGYMIVRNVTENPEVLTVYDLGGRQVVSITVNSGEERNVNLESGIYIVDGRKIML